jgi:hypothetical protein
MNYIVRKYSAASILEIFEKRNGLYEIAYTIDARSSKISYLSIITSFSLKDDKNEERSKNLENVSLEIIDLFNFIFKEFKGSELNEWIVIELPSCELKDQLEIFNVKKILKMKNLFSQDEKVKKHYLPKTDFI